MKIQPISRVSILNYGHLKTGSPFAKQKKESRWFFRLCFLIDLALRAAVAALLVAALAVILWKSLIE